MNREHRSTRKKSNRAMLLICVSLFSPGAFGQWVVTDPGNMFINKLDHLDKAMRWVETVKQYEQTLLHQYEEAMQWKKELVSVAPLDLKVMDMKPSFEKVADDFAISESCPSPKKFNPVTDITSALTGLKLDPNSEIVEEQFKICRYIAMTRNRKYNDTVDYLDAVANHNEKFKELQEQRNGTGESSGNLHANSNEVERFKATLEMAREQWESNMRQHDAQIGALEGMQANLSRRALNGKPSILGTVASAATLKIALAKDD